MGRGETCNPGKETSCGDSERHKRPGETLVHKCEEVRRECGDPSFLKDFGDLIINPNIAPNISPSFFHPFYSHCLFQGIENGEVLAYSAWDSEGNLLGCAISDPAFDEDMGDGWIYGHVFFLPWASGKDCMDKIIEQIKKDSGEGKIKRTKGLWTMIPDYNVMAQKLAKIIGFVDDGQQKIFECIRDGKKYSVRKFTREF